MTIKKIKVLLHDPKGLFNKIFQKDLGNEFELTDSSTENTINNFDPSIFVVYNKSDLIDFLKLEKKGSNILVCLFSKRLSENLSFLEEISDLIVLDSYKTRKRIVKDLKLYLKNNKQSAEDDISDSAKNQAPFHSFFKTVLLFV